MGIRNYVSDAAATASAMLYCLVNHKECLTLGTQGRNVYVMESGIQYRDIVNGKVLSTPYPNKYYADIVDAADTVIMDVSGIVVNCALQYNCGSFLVYTTCDGMSFAYIPSERDIVTFRDEATLVLETLRNVDKSVKELRMEKVQGTRKVTIADKELEIARLQKYLESTDPATAATEIINSLYLSQE